MNPRPHPALLERGLSSYKYFLITVERTFNIHDPEHIWTLASAWQGELIYVFTFSVATIIAVNRHHWHVLFWSLGLLVMAVSVSSEFSDGGWIALCSAVIVACMIVLAGGGLKVSPILGAILGAEFSVMLGGGAESVVMMESAVISTIASVFLANYLRRRAVNEETLQLRYIWKLNLFFNGLFSTRFTDAILSNVDFSQVNLAGVRFKRAYIFNCCFKQAKNSHLALTDGTVLANRQVRELVVQGITTDDAVNEVASRDLVVAIQQFAVEQHELSRLLTQLSILADTLPNLTRHEVIDAAQTLAQAAVIPAKDAQKKLTHHALLTLKGLVSDLANTPTALSLSEIIPQIARLLD
ncbi:MAG: pentapeptide repeat-containing protein [Gallionella sp.]